MRSFFRGVALVAALLLWALRTVVDGAQFNQQVMARVHERIEEFMIVPIEIIRRVSIFRSSGGFPNDLGGVDRDFTYKLLRMEDPISLYYGLEDGTFINYNDDFTIVSYREPGESGYDTTNDQDMLSHWMSLYYGLEPGALIRYNDDFTNVSSREPGESGNNDTANNKDMLKHWISCIDRNDGTEQVCKMEEGSPYVQCVDQCKLVKCPDVNSQRNCSALEQEDEAALCEEETKWCPNYNIRTVSPGENLGFVPLTYSCVDLQGQNEQEPGKVYKGSSSIPLLGNCYYEDGVTLVNRTLFGNYSYCGDTGVCNPFVGGFRSRDYDPRVRSWYVLAKEQQKPVWSSPYPFFTNLNMGITYSAPIHEVSTERGVVFKGVFAVDYELHQISAFLSGQFNVTEDEIMVGIVEADEPNYLIAVSTGSSVSTKVLKANLTEPCPDDTSPNCTVARIPIHEFQSTEEDFILQRAFQAQAAANHPAAELVPFKESDEIASRAFFSQGEMYEQEDANMRWRIIVVMPMTRSTTDEVLPGSTSFFMLSLFASVGFLVCLVLCVVFLGYRHERAVQYADWRFTGAFIFFCSALNLSSFTLLGTNTNEVCMARMWLFNALITCALSPLFVKVWRMYKLVTASTGFRRVNVTHFQAFLYSLPICVVELLILTVVSFADPPRVVEVLENEGGFGIQRIICEQESQAFFYTQLAYDGILVLVGCVLAIKTRNLDEKYGEAKQLAFAMYNIAFTGIVVVAVLQLADMEPDTMAIIYSGGICWGTVFSSFAFVLPRLLTVMENKSTRAIHRNRRFTLKSGNEVLVSHRKSQESALSPSTFSSGNLIRDSTDDIQSTDFNEDKKVMRSIAGESLPPIEEGSVSETG